MSHTDQRPTSSNRVQPHVKGLEPAKVRRDADGLASYKVMAAGGLAAASANLKEVVLMRPSDQLIDGDHQDMTSKEMSLRMQARNNDGQTCLELLGRHRGDDPDEWETICKFKFTTQPRFTLKVIVSPLLHSSCLFIHRW